jgi:predicted RNA methylase
MKEKKPGVKQYWSMTEGVYNCLIDTKRTRAFARAIKKTVKKGDVVVDLGTGSGVLAMVAAQAGAKKVYAIELDVNNIKNLKATFAQNGLDSVIEIIPADALEVTVPEKVTVVIAEMVATGLIEELQVKAMNNILKFTTKNVKVILNKYQTYIDIVSNNEKFYGLSFKILRYEYPNEPSIASTPHSRKIEIASYNFERQTGDLQVSKNIDIKITKAGVVNAIRISGKTTFSDKSSLGATFAYDYPLILPIESIKVKKGDIINVKIQYIANEGLSTLSYKAIKY